MAILKVLFPLSFGVKDVKKLLIRFIIYIVLGALVGWLCGVLSGLPLIGWLLAIVCRVIGWIVDVYVTVGVILLLLPFFKII